MPETDLYRLFTDRLAELPSRYVVTGSVAGSILGEPRLTNDVDIVLELPKEALDDLGRLFPADEFYCPPVEVLKVEARRSIRGHFNLIHHDTGYKADIYIRGEDPLHAWALDHAIRIESGAKPLWLAPPEYVILRKMQFYLEGGAEKHLRDIRGILKVCQPLKDLPWLEAQIAALGLDEPWRKVKEEH